MPSLAVSRSRRRVTARTLAFPAFAPRPVEIRSVDGEFRQYLRAHFGLRPILAACLVWALAVLFYAFIATRAHAGSVSEHDAVSRQFSPVACYQLVQQAGRMIAWARWEEGFSLEKMRSGQFREGTPDWMIGLVQDWITDAYQWRATDEQVHQWAAELGNVDDLPGADQLNAHQTIAIWMRRIARQCDGQHA